MERSFGARRNKLKERVNTMSNKIDRIREIIPKINKWNIEYNIYNDAFAHCNFELIIPYGDKSTTKKLFEFKFKVASEELDENGDLYIPKRTKKKDVYLECVRKASAEIIRYLEYESIIVASSARYDYYDHKDKLLVLDGLELKEKQKVCLNASRIETFAFERRVRPNYKRLCDFETKVVRK